MGQVPPSTFVGAWSQRGPMLWWRVRSIAMAYGSPDVYPLDTPEHLEVTLARASRFMQQFAVPGCRFGMWNGNWGQWRSNNEV